jgi:hypothetical protein
MEPQTESRGASRQSRAPLEASPRPDIPVASHPISGFYYLPTPPVEIFLNTVAQWIDLGVTGGYFSARPQLGKTWAQRYLRANLCAMMKQQFPIFRYICPDSNKSIITENKFYGDMLGQCEHDLSSSGNASVKRLRLVHFMVEQAHSMGASRALLLVDEAHQLTELHYPWLMAIYNLLLEHGIRLVTVLTGQEQLKARRAELLADGQDQIIGRFMLMKGEFTGLRSVEDIRATLKLYDFDERFPVDSDWTYFRFFLPRAYAAGVRLSDEAQLIWTLYGEVARGAGLPAFCELGMADFSTFVHSVLKGNMDNDSEDFKLTREVLLDAIQYSSFVSRAQGERSSPKGREGSPRT